MDAGVGTQEVVCGSSNYFNIVGGVCIKGLESMVYDMLEKSYQGEDQVEYCIPLAFRRFSDLHTMVDLHDIADIGDRFYAYGREA